jgi:hypothetical protein
MFPFGILSSEAVEIGAVAGGVVTSAAVEVGASVDETGISLKVLSSM